MKYRLLKKRYLKPKPLSERNAASSRSPENDISSNHTAMELEAAAALLMLRYQYDLQSAAKIETAVDVPISESSRSPTPPPPCLTDNCTPKEQQVRMAASSQPLKKRSIPSHLLRRSLTPAKQGSQNQIAIVKAKVKAKTPLPCVRSDSKTDNKALLKSCRNMIREFLDNQEKI